MTQERFDFAPFAPAHRGGAPFVALITIVFLLLIFFLMTTAITVPEPVNLTPQEAMGPAANLPPDTLFVATDGKLAFETARGEAVFAALSARAEAGPITLRADARLPARDLAALLPRIGAAGVTELRLVTVQP
ncbi:MAG: biopolymer transporter ExbD [Pseudomonadota bacterium]